MKLLIPNLSGVTPKLKNLLKKKYPDCEFEIDQDPVAPGGGRMLVAIWTERKNGKRYGVKVAFTNTVIESGPEVIDKTIEDAVQKLREHCASLPDLYENNPSSRWFS